MSAWVCGSHTDAAYSSFGLISALYAVSFARLHVSAYEAESLVGLVCDGGDVIAPIEVFLYLNS